jgi:hypothetical protein
MRRSAHNAPAPAKDTLFNTQPKRGGNGFAIAASLHTLCPDMSSTTRTAFARSLACRHQETRPRRVETTGEGKYAVCPVRTKLIRVWWPATVPDAHAAHPSNARSKLRSKTFWGFRAERAQQSINQSIRPRSRFRAPAARICKRHAMDATPMMPLPRLSYAAQHMETWATAARILSCTQGLSFPASVETRD